MLNVRELTDAELNSAVIEYLRRNVKIDSNEEVCVETPEITSTRLSSKVADYLNNCGIKPGLMGYSALIRVLSVTVLDPSKIRRLGDLYESVLIDEESVTSIQRVIHFALKGMVMDNKSFIAKATNEIRRDLGLSVK